ncbi:XdhC family protein [Nisaea acidiphila]|uniref:XdhC family protein n=1 Tax=Nisaea acidiphila TaxID=1862145 RepID=A0A9J7AWW5_9PROT|nr:XdhC family protein [Nisaea acidiphila]UUX51855.1 XdhC family protein [Nisaea acidiphila]
MERQHDDVFSAIAALMEGEAEFCVATVVRTQNATSAKAGAKAVVLSDGTIKGFLGGGCVQGAVRRSAAEVLAAGEPRLIRVKPGDEVVERLDRDGVELHKSGCPSGGTVDIFIEPMRQAPRVVICGGSPVATVLARLAATLGYRVTAAALAEDLDGFAADATRHEGFALDGLDLRQRDFVVVATQGKRDREALAAALGSDAGFVSFVGSRRKAQALRGQLAERGVSETRRDALKAPAGLDINAIEPEEIALSIMAELVAVRRQKARDGAETGGRATA